MFGGAGGGLTLNTSGEMKEKTARGSHEGHDKVLLHSSIHLPQIATLIGVTLCIILGPNFEQLGRSARLQQTPHASYIIAISSSIGNNRRIRHDQST